MVDFRDLAREMDTRWHDDGPVPPPEPWRRGWGTSWLRTLIGIVTVGLVVWLLVAFLPLDHPSIISSGPFEGFAYADAEGFLLGMSAGYVLWVGTWLDHIMARHGSLPTFLTVAGGAAAFELLQGNLFALVGSASLLVIIVAFAAAYCMENALVPNSFEGMERSFRPF